MPEKLMRSTIVMATLSEYLDLSLGCSHTCLSVSAHASYASGVAVPDKAGGRVAQGEP